MTNFRDKKNFRAESWKTAIWRFSVIILKSGETASKVKVGDLTRWMLGRRKTNYHSRGRHFTNPDELAASEQRAKKEKEWKKKQGIEDSESEEEKEEQASSGPSAKTQGAPGELPPSDSEGEYSDSDDDEEKEQRPKGVQHLIEVENPNHIKQKSKKISTLETESDGKANLTRKQKEELEKQQARERYMKAHLAGKTEEARADMARLAIIRKQREDAARKKNEEKAAQEAAKKEAEEKLLQKRKEDRKK